MVVLKAVEVITVRGNEVKRPLSFHFHCFLFSYVCEIITNIIVIFPNVRRHFLMGVPDLCMLSVRRHYHFLLWTTFSYIGPQF